ncbi:MAG: AraC family transcriptional regulator [Gemmatimonadetes bacterium]|nr:AraC family transcriptional regulator [Gemmatimonadota bacterium]
MAYRTLVPSSPLSDFVALLWLYDGYARPHPKERLLPTGTVELVIDLREGTRGGGGAVVCGAYSEFFEIGTAAEMSVIGVHFRPGGAFPFFAPPVGELHNLHVPLEDLWGPGAVDLRERLLAARTPALRLRILERELLIRAIRPLVRHRAVAGALRWFEGPHARTVAEVSRDTGLSHRRFIELFKAEVGLTPKLFCRVRRFQEVVRIAHARSEIDWARTALACGYFDQAHFIHDFRAFAGLTPSAYLARRTEHMNHVPLEA